MLNGPLVRELRVAHRWSIQRCLFEAYQRGFDISEATWRRVEKDDLPQISLEKALAVAAALGKPVDEIAYRPTAVA